MTQAMKHVLGMMKAELGLRVGALLRQAAVRTVMVTAAMMTGAVAHAVEPQSEDRHIPLFTDNYSANTDALLVAFGKYVAIPDVDGDEELTDIDFIGWFVEHVGGVVVADLNADGAINCTDVVLTVAVALSTLQADVNADGAITVEDVTAVLERMLGNSIEGEPLVVGDINGDMKVDELDLVAALAAVGAGAQPGDDAVSSAALLVLATNACGGSGGFASSHAEYFSGTWPVGPSHILGPSWRRRPPHAPDNHDATVTRTWPVVPHGHDWPISDHLPTHVSSLSGQWLPNHMGEMSRLYPPDHATHTSTRWPSNHVADASGQWYPTLPPGQTPPHVVSTSRGWGPGHTLEISGDTTQPVHDGGASNWTMPPQSPHHTTISGSWTHNVEQSSRAYPPNHYGMISSSWPQSHTANTSMYWPGGHYVGPSSSWPADTDPVWPPNHFAQTSSQWSQPGDPIHVFPPGHSIWTTATQAIPIIGGD